MKKISGKRLVILVGLAFFGAFMVIRVAQGFQIAGLFVKEKATEDARVAIKRGKVCIVETSDRTPRRMEYCPYKVGDLVTVIYSKCKAGIESHLPGE